MFGSKRETLDRAAVLSVRCSWLRWGWKHVKSMAGCANFRFVQAPPIPIAVLKCSVIGHVQAEEQHQVLRSFSKQMRLKGIHQGGGGLSKS